MSRILEVILGELKLVTGRIPWFTSSLCGAIFLVLSPSFLWITSSARDILGSSWVMILIWGTPRIDQRVLWRQSLSCQSMLMLTERWCSRKCCLQSKRGGLSLLVASIVIQEDNCKVHTWATRIIVESRARELGLNLAVKPQPPNSPDFNVLDLGFFHSIQSLKDHKDPKNIDGELILAVQNAVYWVQAWETVDNVFLSLQGAMVQRKLKLKSISSQGFLY